MAKDLGKRYPAPIGQDEAITIHNCKILETVVQQGSFIKAAAELNLTPSAVSHAIAKLEKNFGLVLFMRTRKGVALTPAGKHILPYIRSVQQSNELLYQEVNQIHDLLLGTVCISASHSMVIHWLPQVIRKFHREYPNIEIKLYQGSPSKTKDWIRDGVIDLAFLSGELPEQMEASPVFYDSLVCLAPEWVPEPPGGAITVEMLRTMNLISQRDGYNPEVQAFLERNRLGTDSSHYVESEQALAATVEAGMGCCILPQMSLRHLAIRRSRAYPLSPMVTYTIYLAAPHSLEGSPATRELRNYIIGLLRQEPISPGGPAGERDT